jgi:hypothetical protein
MSRTYYKKKLSSSLVEPNSHIFQLSFLIANSFQIVNIEYPKLGEVLAMFNSIMSIILLLGFFGKLTS